MLVGRPVGATRAGLHLCQRQNWCHWCHHILPPSQARSAKPGPLRLMPAVQQEQVQVDLLLWLELSLEACRRAGWTIEMDNDLMLTVGIDTIKQYLRIISYA